MNRKHTALLILILSLVFAWSDRAMALSVDLDLGPHGNYTDQRYALSDLNGTSLAGQKISLDFDFSDDFLRIYSITNAQNLFIGLEIQTDVAGNPGFLSETSAYMLDEKGKQYAGPVGSGRGDNGTIGMGLFPFWGSENGGISKLIHQVPIDFYGAHFEFVLPSFLEHKITSSEFRILTSNPPRADWYEAVFGIGPEIPKDFKVPSVPDAGSTLAMLGMALVAIGGLKRFRALN